MIFCRYMDALWLPLDNINCGSTTPKSSICFHLPRMDNRNTLLGHWSFGQFLLIQFVIFGVLEHHAHLGNRQLRFGDLARDILGTTLLPCNNIDLVVKEGFDSFKYYRRKNVLNL